MKSMKLFGKAKTAQAECPCQQGSTRRAWLDKVGTGGLVAGVAGLGIAMMRSLVPNVLYEQPQRFKAGLPNEFPQGGTFLEDQRVFIFRENNTFYAISAVCAHLGCTVKLVNLNQPKQIVLKGKSVSEQREFHCPCHGSKYYEDGTNYAGPAPRPLTWYRIELAPEDGSLVVNLNEPVGQDFRLTV